MKEFKAKYGFVTDRDTIYLLSSHLIGGYTIEMSKWNQSVHAFLTHSVTEKGKRKKKKSLEDFNQKKKLKRKKNPSPKEQILQIVSACVNLHINPFSRKKGTTRRANHYPKQIYIVLNKSSNKTRDPKDLLIHINWLLKFTA